MRQAGIEQETSKLGLFSLAALALHVLVILFATPRPVELVPAFQQEILVTWEDPSTAPSDRAASEGPETRTEPGHQPETQATASLSPVHFQTPLATQRSEPAIESPVDSPVAEAEDTRLAIDLASSGEGQQAARQSGVGTPFGQGTVGTEKGTGSSTISTHAREQRKATLLGQSPCADLFPYGAKISSATVAVSVQVDRDGRARFSRVLSRLPDAGGFTAATVACSSRLRFAPARDETGAAVTSQAVVRLHFERNG